MPVLNPTVGPFDVLVTRLHESHQLSVYEAIERLVQAAEAVGLDQHALVRLLDQGKTFEGVLELVEAKMERLQAA